MPIIGQSIIGAFLLKTSGNVLTLLLTGPPSSLSATNTTSSSCLSKKSTIPASYLQPPITPSAFRKQSINSYTANPPQSSPLPTTSPGTSLADSFASFFTGKISKLRLSLTSNPTTSSPHSPSPPGPPLTSQFSPLPQNPKSTTVQTTSLTQIPYPPGFLKNVYPYLCRTCRRGSRHLGGSGRLPRCQFCCNCGCYTCCCCSFC